MFYHNKDVWNEVEYALIDIESAIKLAWIEEPILFMLLKL
tara:strand:- start:20935 stop:21054 length:120 start_codon:yes stop_codon:yes gene_type:complete